MSFSWLKGKNGKRPKRKTRVASRNRHGETGRDCRVPRFEPIMGCDTPRARSRGVYSINVHIYRKSYLLSTCNELHEIYAVDTRTRNIRFL